MKPALNNGAFLIVPFYPANFINQSVFGRYPSGPISFESETEGFWFAQALKRFTLNGSDQFPDFVCCIQIRFQPVGIIVPGITSEFNVHRSLPGLGYGIALIGNRIALRQLIQRLLQPLSVGLRGEQIFRFL